MSRESPSPQALAKKLIARAAKDHPESGATTGAAQSAYAACETTYRAIARCIGASGANALLSRALAEANKTHPLLRTIRLDQPDAKPSKIPDAGAGAKGSLPSEEGLEALLEMMITLLARFVGMDMVVQLVAQRATIGTMEHEDPQ